MRFNIQKSNTKAESLVNIVVYLKDESQEAADKVTAAMLNALPTVRYSLQPAMVGSEGMPEDEYNMLATYTVTQSTKPADAVYRDRHPGNSEIEIKVRVFSGHHSTIEEMVAEYRKQGEARMIDMASALSGLNLPPMAVAEHIMLFRKNVLGIED